VIEKGVEYTRVVRREREGKREKFFVLWGRLSHGRGTLIFFVCGERRTWTSRIRVRGGADEKYKLGPIGSPLGLFRGEQYRVRLLDYVRGHYSCCSLTLYIAHGC
jgi:hypothetical protein